MPACGNCQNSFEITPADRRFLDKFEVPDPKWCPRCREQRRWTFRNERTLYPRSCDLCGKQIIAIFAKDKSYKVYCNDCWWSDKWDATTYGRDFDFSKPFFPQFQALLEAVPHVARYATNNTNSEYVHGETDDKDCYMNFGGHWNDHCFYNMYSIRGRDCMDNYWVYESELCYECNDSFNCYQCFFSQNLKNCRNVWFCFDCRNIENCFGCSNLRGGKYKIFNEQYTKEAYERKVTELTNGHATLEKTKELVRAHHLKFPKRFAFFTQVEDSTGNYLTQSRLCYDAYDVDEGENLRRVIIIAKMKDSCDITTSGWNEQCYEVQAVAFSSHLRFVCNNFAQSLYLDYSYNCANSENLFGCAEMRKGKYAILNKVYAPDKYRALRGRIIAHMKETGEFGEFFPPVISLFGYNETAAALYFPMTKEEVLAKGWNWYDGAHGTFGKETMLPEAIPDRIEDVPETITKEMLKCVECSRNYTVIKPELAFYRKNHLPIPRKCYECRHRARLALRNPRQLWHRQCDCGIVTHAHHTSGRCVNEFETSYAPASPDERASRGGPDRTEKIFCEACFNAEVL